MPYTLEQLTGEIRSALQGGFDSHTRQQLCESVAGALNDPEFVARHFSDRTPGAGPREVLYEDPDIGFCVCRHIYDSAAIGEPHDHGDSWAIYGQASGETEMTEWQVVEAATDDQPAVVEPVRTYTMRPGDVQFYDVGTVHSPHRAHPVKLLRVEGRNLDQVKRTPMVRKKDQED